jgi:hypothetical protein
VILIELQDQLRCERRASLAQLSMRFGIEPAALRGMLDRLVDKGRVRRLERPLRCSGCRVCPDEALDFYEWAATGSPPSPAPECGVDFKPASACRHC